MNDSSKAIVAPEPPGTSAGNAGGNYGSGSRESVRDKPRTALPQFIRAAAGALGFVLILPGFWSLYSIWNQWNLNKTFFGRAENVFLAAVLWAISIALMRYAFKGVST